MNFLDRNRIFGRRGLAARLLTLVCLGALLLLGARLFLPGGEDELSFLLPLYQDGEPITPSAIISEEGAVLLPVAAVAERNGWLCQQDHLQGETGAHISALLLLDETGGRNIAVCWYGAAEGEIAALNVWAGGEVLTLSGGGLLHKGDLFLPEDLFSAAMGLKLKLGEDGKATLLPLDAETPTDAPAV